MINLSARIEHQKEKALHFLLSNQHANGSFDSLSSSDSADFSIATKQCTLFANALILSALNSGPDNTICRSLATFIISQKTDNWSFNYWIKGSQQVKEYPYPNDLDDTACALSALYQHNPELLDGKAMASIITLFTTNEVVVGGPYRTWLVAKDLENTWLDVDLAVNAQIGFFFSLLGITLPNLTSLFDKAIDNKEFTSSYYPSPFVSIYFLSRFYQGNKKEQLISYLLSCQESFGIWDNPLHTSLVVSSLAYLGYPVVKLTKSIEYVVKQSEQVGWKPYTLYLDPVSNNQPHYAGSTNLTAAFFVEALHQYQTALEKSLPKAPRSLIAQKIEIAIKKRFSSISPAFKKVAAQEFSFLLKKDGDTQILLHPAHFAESLLLIEPISDTLLIRLGLISTYGWMAYTIYDDFLDEEGITIKLPIANVCLRELTVLAEGNDMILSLLDRIEAANFWEVTNCRTSLARLFITPLPDYGDFTLLAERSIGHAIGPLLILDQLGYKSDSHEFQKLKLFFIHYLTARQLNDDAHDWKSDLDEGKLTSVVTLLLSGYKKETGNWNLEELSLFFWEQTLPKVSELMVHHCDRARKTLETLSVIKRPEYLLSLLEPLEKSAQEALTEHHNITQFIATY